MRRAVKSLIGLNRCSSVFRRKSSAIASEQEAEYVSFPSDSQNKARDQTRKAFRPTSVDPSKTSILLFPGQGAQFVGMGKQLQDYKEAMDLFTMTSDIVKYDLYKICTEGPLETLSRTEVCQLATLVTSVGALIKLREADPQALENCVGTAGFSVGEYAALVFAGVLSFEDAVQMVQARALAMQAASDQVPSGMMTVFLKHESKLNFAMLAAREYCKQRLDIPDPVCSIANYLFPEVKVIGGNSQALEFIEANLSEFNIKRVKRLPVSGAFHTSLMKPAAKEFQKALVSMKFEAPIIPVHANVDGSVYTKNWNNVRRLLIQQIFRPVRWEQLTHTLYHRSVGEGFPNTYEVGPGTQLGTMLRMVNKKAHLTYNKVDV